MPTILQQIQDAYGKSDNDALLPTIFTQLRKNGFEEADGDKPLSSIKNWIVKAQLTLKKIG
jgi:hypothetical protein